MSDKLQKLQEIIRLANDGLSREEFVDNFKIIIDLVKSIQVSNKETMDSLDTKYAEVVRNLSLESDQLIGETKQNALDFCAEQISILTKNIETKLSEVKNGEDGQDADTTTVALEASKLTQEAIKPLIPTIEQIENDLPKLGYKIRDGLELIPTGAEQLKIEAIYNLRKELDELKRLIHSKTFGGAVVSANSGGHIVKAYDLSSQLNGITKTFSLPAFWRVISIHSSSFPNAFRPTVDYTTDGAAMTITFTSEIEASSTLATGQTIIITYSE